MNNKAKKSSSPPAAERANYIREMLNLKDDGTKNLVESIEGPIKIGNWSTKEKLAWLQGYDTEPEMNRNTGEISR